MGKSQQHAAVVPPLRPATEAPQSSSSEQGTSGERQKSCVKFTSSDRVLLRTHDPPPTTFPP